MAASYTRLALAAFAVLSGGVVANVLTQPTNQAKLSRMTAPPAAEPARRTPPSETASVAPVRTQKDGRPLETDAAASDLVRAIQRELQARGYEPGAQDGVPGLVTRAAIYAFEEDHRLTPSGEPSETVLKLILLGGASAIPAAGQDAAQARSAAEQLVRAVQQYLAALGYHSTKTDGRMGPDTARGIREFEMDQGLKPAGRITGPLVARLMKASSGSRSAGNR